MARIAVIIPARNEASVIGSTLALHTSLRNLHQLNVSFIVVDGYSSDNTVELARPLADTIAFDLPGEAGTVAAARNIGARAAGDAKILFHTDADVTMPHLAELLSQVETAFADPDVVALTTNIRPEPNGVRTVDRIMHRCGNTMVRIMLRYGGYLGRGECQIVRSDVFAALGGYRDEIVVGEDCELMHRLVQRGTVVFLRDQYVYHSTRRFQQWGYPRTLALYLREGLWLMLFRRSYLRRWDTIR